MSETIRVIPCLDVDAGRVVKGVRFQDLADAGDPVQLAARYSEDGADEITFLDVSASVEGRSTTKEVVTATAENVFVPLTVGGGIRSVDDVESLLASGADKVSVNTAALDNPALIEEIANRFGNQVLVLSVDAKRPANGGDGFVVTTHGGRRETEVDALEWIEDGISRGVGEILLNSMDADGVQSGFDLEMIRAARAVTSVPLIASGGAGQVEDFVLAAEAGADAVLAASVFHFETMTIGEVKEGLAAAGFSVRGRTPLPAALAQRLKRDAQGLVCAVIQDYGNQEVLMVGWMDDEALARTLREGRVTFWSRSRQEYWRKGDTSGHTQFVKSVSLDCDGDALLIVVDQIGAACHTGARSCFTAGGKVATAGGILPLDLSSNGEE